MTGKSGGRRGLRLALGSCLLAGTAVLAACGTSAGPGAQVAGEAGAPQGQSTQPATGQGGGLPTDVVMRAPGKLTEATLSPDVLIYSKDTLAPAVVRRIAHVHGVVAANQFSMASFFVEEQEVRYGAVDPASFRRYTPATTAQYTEIWNRVANGEIAVSKGLDKRVLGTSGYLRMGNARGAQRIHIGAYADLIPSFDAVLNQKWAHRLHMVPGNAMVLSTGTTAPETLTKRLKAIAGSAASVQILAHVFDTNVPQTAVLTGSSVAAAVGTFNYSINRDGTVNPQQSWVQTYIRSEDVPLLGRVTCNKVMLPQLRAALTEVQQRGLGAKVYHYDGCYVPRFINHNPADGLSFHTFGTAIDINAAQNQRGGRGQMDRTVVSIFEKWGFTWGGTWHYTDPMHFELNRIVKVA
jgi:hypothetical protein